MPDCHTKWNIFFIMIKCVFFSSQSKKHFCCLNYLLEQEICINPENSSYSCTIFSSKYLSFPIFIYLFIYSSRRQVSKGNLKRLRDELTLLVLALSWDLLNAKTKRKNSSLCLFSNIWLNILWIPSRSIFYHITIYKYCMRFAISSLLPCCKIQKQVAVQL